MVKAGKAATVFLRNGLSLLESMPSSSIEAANKGQCRSQIDEVESSSVELSSMCN